MNDSKIMLITGASGSIGSAYRHHLAENPNGYTLRLTDIRLPSTETTSDNWYIGNLSEPDFAQTLMSGVDTVVHMGADPNPDADFYGSLLDNNIKATYNVFQAAVEAGVRKIIYASSASVGFGYLKEDVGRQVHGGLPVRPITIYSATKCWGEGLASAFNAKYGIEILCVRIGWFVTRSDLLNTHDFELDILRRIVTDRDLSHLFDCCLSTDGLGYAILAGLSNNRFPFLDLSETRRLVGYNPQDDAFEITGCLPVQTPLSLT